MKQDVKYDSTEDTNNHKKLVYGLLVKIAEELATRAVEHDLSKLGPDEKPIIDKRELMKPAIRHHHSVNRHHPEYFKRYKCTKCFSRFDIELIKCPDCGCQLLTVEPRWVNGMNLVDIIEMFCDIAALSIYNNDNILKRLSSHQKHFGYGTELAFIFRNTVGILNA